MKKGREGKGGKRKRIPVVNEAAATGLTLRNIQEFEMFGFER